MATSEFTSGPLRDLSARELGVSGFSDFELLSDGGHNRVYRAMADGKRVVLKVAKEEEGNAARNRLLLQREYDIMHAIDCLYVVKTWQMTDVPELGRAIVMEYVAGRTLDCYLKEKPSFAERRRIADELMEALIYLHERQVVHGDLKSSNILITDAGNHIRLIDFGFADTDAYIAKNIGTSPSIADTMPVDSDHLPIAKDIYALGKILERLFPRRLRMIVRRCCSAKHVRRYASVRRINTAVHRYWQMMRLMPLLFAGLLVVAALLWLSRSEESMPQPLPDQPMTDSIWQEDSLYHMCADSIADIPEKTKNTTAVPLSRSDKSVPRPLPDQPIADSSWLSVKEEAEKQYKSLFQVYADSLAGMTEKTMNAAIPLLGGYGDKMLEEHKRLMQTYPQYEEPLQELYMYILSRDHLRLRNICEDYPLIYSDWNGKK
ncbi:MAG: protein kinase [Paludibacteraceae bacterium]|nr:protein kinase [Paludibacteraceae bacterium]